MSLLLKAVNYEKGGRWKTSFLPARERPYKSSVKEENSRELPVEEFRKTRELERTPVEKFCKTREIKWKALESSVKQEKSRENTAEKLLGIERNAIEAFHF